MLELGNLEVAAGSLQDAAAAYERLIRERPRAHVLTEAYFNLAIVPPAAWRWGGGADGLLPGGGPRPAHELAPVAYIKIGRSYMDQGEFEQAVSPLRRAVAAAAGTKSQPAAVAALAAAYLLDGNPRAANALSCGVPRRGVPGTVPTDGRIPRRCWRITEQPPTAARFGARRRTCWLLCWRCLKTPS